MESATRSSSVCRRGFPAPRYSVFSRWIGMIDSAETSFSSCGMPAYSFKTFIRHAAAAPRRSDVFPVMIRPSSISIAVAGCPVSSARRSAGRRTLRSSGVTCACLSSSSCLYSSFGEAFPFLTFTALSKYLRIISCFAASLQTASSEIANPAMLTPMSVGDLYGHSPIIPSKICCSTGKISTSLL